MANRAHFHSWITSNYPNLNNTIVRYKLHVNCVQGPDYGWRCYDRVRGSTFI